MLSGVVIADIGQDGSNVARMKIEELIFDDQANPVNKFECAAQKSFMDLVMYLMGDGGRFIKL